MFEPLLDPDLTPYTLKGNTMAKNKIDTKTLTTFIKLSRVPIAGEMIRLTKEDSAKLGGAKFAKVTSITHTDRAEGQSAIVKAVIV